MTESPQATTVPAVGAARTGCRRSTANIAARNSRANDASFDRQDRSLPLEMRLVETDTSHIVSLRIVGGPWFHALTIGHTSFNSIPAGCWFVRILERAAAEVNCAS